MSKENEQRLIFKWKKANEHKISTKRSESPYIIIREGFLTAICLNINWSNGRSETKKANWISDKISHKKVSFRREIARCSVLFGIILSHTVCTYWPSKRVDCDEMKKRSVQIFTPQESSFSLVFWEEKWLMGRPLLSVILGQADPVGAKSPIFSGYSLVAPQS